MTEQDNRLKSYKNKRNFKETDEPKAKIGDEENKIFSIHKHDATNLHYDLRISCNSVLKSWAVPKGPSTDPSEKRLAIQTEDHPLEYIDFEGNIPEDEYGGGTVLLWEKGEYENTTTKDGDIVPLEKAIEEGHFTLNLKGEKLQGGYAMTRFDGDEDDENQWLLVKMDDDEADARRNPTSTENKSVKSGKTIEQIKEQS